MMRRTSHDWDYADKVYASDPILSSKIIDYNKYKANHRPPSLARDTAAERIQKYLWSQKIQHNVQICWAGRFEDGIPERNPHKDSSNIKRR